HSVRCVHANSVSAVSRYGSGINPSASRSRWVLPGTWAGIVRSAMFSGTGPEVARMRQPSWRVWWIIVSSSGRGEHSWAKTSKVRVAPRAWTDHPEDSYLSELSKSRKMGSTPPATEDRESGHRGRTAELWVRLAHPSKKSRRRHSARSDVIASRPSTDS